MRRRSFVLCKGWITEGLLQPNLFLQKGLHLQRIFSSGCLQCTLYRIETPPHLGHVDFLIGFERELGAD